MEDRDRRAIEELFEKLSHVESQSGPRDPEAERYIGAQLAAQPGAAYYMAQTIIVQEQALAAAQEQMEEQGRQDTGRPAGGGPLSGIFGASRSRQESRYAGSGRSTESAGGPWGSAPRGGGGGFLAGAAQTAMGVAGGVLLGNMIGGMFGNEGMFGGDDAGGGDLADASGSPNDESAEFDAGGDSDFGGDFDLG